MAEPHQQLGRSRRAGALPDRADGGCEAGSDQECFSLGEVAETVAPAGENALSRDREAFRLAALRPRRHGAEGPGLPAAGKREKKKKQKQTPAPHKNSQW